MTKERPALAARVVHAGLGLLDRHILDRNGEMCGKVDDLELRELDDAGNLYVSAIHTGPGALLVRTEHFRLGRWLRRFVAWLNETDGETGGDGRIPFQRVASIGNHVTVSLERHEIATFGGERWVRDHVIGPIPGSAHDVDE